MHNPGQAQLENVAPSAAPLTSLVPPIYCLTLAEEPWKRAVLEADLAALSLEATFLTGFYGANLGVRSSNPFTYNLNGVPEYIHINTLGCYLSHLMALRVALAANHPEFIILEEDAALHPFFPSAFATLRQSLPPAVNLLVLELFDTDIAKPGTILNDHCRLLYYPFGAAALWWRRDAAQLAISHLHPICEPFDIALMQRVYPFCKVAVAQPSLVRQRSACGEWPSTIHGAVL